MAFNETLTGEVCHIKGVRPGSARHDANQPPAERHQYENLVLMCPTHHTVIDDDEKSYTVDRLQQMKREHEEKSAPVSDAESDRVAQIYMQAENVFSTNQSGGITANIVNASNITLQRAPSSSHLTQQRQIQAVENIWNVIRNFSKEFSSVIFIDSILLPQEIDDYMKGKTTNYFMDSVTEFRDQKIILQKIANSGANEANKERPFISHRLWSIFFVINAVYGRFCFLLANSFKEKRFVDWRSDSGVDQLLRSILPNDAVGRVKKLQFGGMQTAIDYLQNQFLTEAGMNRPSA